MICEGSLYSPPVTHSSGRCWQNILLWPKLDTWCIEALPSKHLQLNRWHEQFFWVQCTDRIKKLHNFLTSLEISVFQEEAWGPTTVNHSNCVLRFLPENCETRIFQLVQYVSKSIQFPTFVEVEWNNWSKFEENLPRWLLNHSISLRIPIGARPRISYNAVRDDVGWQRIFTGDVSPKRFTILRQVHHAFLCGWNNGIFDEFSILGHIWT